MEKEQLSGSYQPTTKSKVVFAHLERSVQVEERLSAVLAISERGSASLPRICSGSMIACASVSSLVTEAVGRLRELLQ